MSLKFVLLTILVGVAIATPSHYHHSHGYHDEGRHEYHMSHHGYHGGDHGHGHLSVDHGQGYHGGHHNLGYQGGHYGLAYHGGHHGQGYHSGHHGQGYHSGHHGQEYRGGDHGHGYHDHHDSHHDNIDYKFKYNVKDDKTYNYQSRDEYKDGKNVYGSYSLAQPDGKVRIVKYKADGYGFQADVDYKGGYKHDYTRYGQQEARR